MAHSRCLVLLLAVAALLLGCGNSGMTPVTMPGAAGAGGGDGHCPPGEHPNPAGGCCPAGTAALDDGTCRPAGIPADDCGDGFVHDGDCACEPILPAKPCPFGLMAVPGDTECHEVAPCGDEKWGDIPVEPNTQYVDGSYAVGESDGSADKPWTRIQDGIDAADPGAIVAVASGTYEEDLLILNRPVRLWGRCPAMVEVVATVPGASEFEPGFIGIDIRTGANGTEVRDLAVTGHTVGIWSKGSEGVLLDQLWIHEPAMRGVVVHGSGSSVTLRRSLVEHVPGLSVWVLGAEVSVESTVVRETTPESSGLLGVGLWIGVDPTTSQPASVTIDHALIDANHEAGIQVFGSMASIESTVVRGTRPNSNSPFARAIGVGHDASFEMRADVSVRRSLLSDNDVTGIVICGSDVTIESTAVRDTQLSATGDLGRGIVVACTAECPERADVTIVRSLFDGNHDAGVLVSSAEVAIESTVVRHTQPNDAGESGRGVTVQSELESCGPATVSFAHSLLEGNHEFGASVTTPPTSQSPTSQLDAELTVVASVIRDTLPRATDGAYGLGLVSIRATVGLSSSVIRGGYVAGVATWGGDVSLDDSLIADVLSGDFYVYDPKTKYENVGDGLLAHDSDLSVTRTRVEGCERAGILADASSGSLAHVVSTNNRFGMSLQGNPLPSYAESCSFAGNAEQDILSDGNLPVPDAPPEMPEPP